MSSTNPSIPNLFPMSSIKSKSPSQILSYFRIKALGRLLKRLPFVIGLVVSLGFASSSLVSCTYSPVVASPVASDAIVTRPAANNAQKADTQSSAHDQKHLESAPDDVRSSSSATLASKKIAVARPSLVAINSLGLAPVKISSMDVSRKVATSDLTTISAEVVNAFRANTSTAIVPLGEIKGASKAVLGGDKDSLLAIAKSNNIDGLLIVELQDFSNRTGSSFGTNQGAVFGVVVKVIDVASGRDAWEGSYHEQDSAGPLVNISGGHVKKLQFRTVENLMQEGFRKLATEFSESRLKAYMAK